MSKTVEIYRLADLEKTDNEMSSIASLPIIVSRTYEEVNTDVMDVEEASFHSSEQRKTAEGYPILSFSCRIKISCYSLFSIIDTGSEFIIREGFLKMDKGVQHSEFPSGGNKFAVGPASNYEVHLRARGGYDLLPKLIFVKVDRNREGDAFVGAACPRAIEEGFPLLHFTTSMDFDDGVGLLAIGTCKGYLCFARIFPEEMISSASLMDQLPTRKSPHEELSVVSLHQCHHPDEFT